MHLPWKRFRKELRILLRPTRSKLAGSMLLFILTIPMALIPFLCFEDVRDVIHTRWSGCTIFFDSPWVMGLVLLPTLPALFLAAAISPVESTILPLFVLFGIVTDYLIAASYMEYAHRTRRRRKLLFFGVWAAGYGATLLVAQYVIPLVLSVFV